MNTSPGRCAACAETYRWDTYHLITAGFRGGKGTFGETCQCCPQSKNAKWPMSHRNPAKAQRRCALSRCCESFPSRRVVQDARDALWAALTTAVAEEEISKNAAAPGQGPQTPAAEDLAVVGPGSGPVPGAVSRARQPLCVAWLLALVFGLRWGEVLGLTWDSVNFETSEFCVDHQRQRAGREILHHETKTENSDDFLPLSDLCLTALKLRRQQHLDAKQKAGEP